MLYYTNSPITPFHTGLRRGVLSRLNEIIPPHCQDPHAFEAKLDRLNQDQSHYMNRNDICTPMGCVREMVDAIPKAFWQRKNLQILDPCAGNGNFHAYIRRFVPMECLTFNEINPKRIDNIRKLFGAHAHISMVDFLHYDEEKKFDLIVANPPYALFDDNGKRKSKNHNLSRAFIAKALHLLKANGLMLFIVPNNWMSLSDRNGLPSTLSQYQFLHINIHGAKRWFPTVGSSFTWFLLQKSENTHSFTVDNNYIWRDRAEVLLRKSVNYIPLYFNAVVDSIFAKTIDAHNTKQGIETNCDLHHYTYKHILSDSPTPHHPYKIIHTPSKTVWSQRPHKFQNGWKVFISLTDHFKSFVGEHGMTQSIAYIRCQSRKEAMQRKAELDMPLFRFLNDMTRYGNFNNIRILQKFPRLAEVNLNDGENRLVMEYWHNYVNNK